MSILDKVKIGTKVQVNLERTKDRLTKETIDAINASSKCVVSDFRLTDGKGIGVILKLSNGKEQWFFENEIEILDINGNVIQKEIKTINSEISKFNIFKNLNYENKIKITDLINPFNFIVWLIVSTTDIF